MLQIKYLSFVPSLISEHIAYLYYCLQMKNQMKLVFWVSLIAFQFYSLSYILGQKETILL